MYIMSFQGMKYTHDKDILWPTYVISHGGHWDTMVVTETRWWSLRHDGCNDQKLFMWWSYKKKLDFDLLGINFSNNDIDEWHWFDFGKVKTKGTNVTINSTHLGNSYTLDLQKTARMRMNLSSLHCLGQIAPVWIPWDLPRHGGYGADCIDEW